MASQAHFKQVMRVAALSADAIVPVVSRATLQSNLPQTEGFFRKEWADLISTVVVTKIQNSVVNDSRKDKLSLAAWGCTDRSKDVLCCDSLFGLGVLLLRDHLSKDLDIPTRFRDTSDPTSEV